MGYVGGSLSALFSEETTGPPTRQLLHDVADAAGHAMTEAAKANTPVDTGRTRESFRQITPHVTVDHSARAVVSGVESHWYIARLLEYGVAPHTIKPRRGKALNTPLGARAEVHHPGHQGTHAVALAAYEVEAGWQGLAAPHLHAWAAAVEQNAKRRPGVA